MSQGMGISVSKSIPELSGYLLWGVIKTSSVRKSASIRGDRQVNSSGLGSRSSLITHIRKFGTTVIYFNC